MTYRVIDNEGVIWGRGETVDEAYQAAIENITETFTDAGEELPEWLASGDLERVGYKIR